MKKISLLFLCFIFALLSYSQKQEVQSQKGKIGLTFSTFGTADGLSFAKGAASYTGKTFYGIGVNYIYSLSKCLDFETGFEFSHYMMAIHPNLPPGADNTIYDVTYSLISLPLLLRINFLKYCFVNGGLGLDFDPATSNPIGN